MDWNQLEIDAFRDLNLTPHQLYEFTPNEYTNMLKGYQQQYEKQLKLGRWTAWHVSAYVGMSFGGEKLPDLEDLLNKPIFDGTASPKDKPKELSEGELYNQSRNYVKAMIASGINVTDKVKKKYDIE
jgi:hypothetical protein